MSCVSITLNVSGVVYACSMVRHFFGQTSTQHPHWMHCILSIIHFLLFLSTVMQLVGHFFIQMPHKMQSSSTIPMCPRVLSCHTLGTTGYMRVAGFLNRLFITNLLIFDTNITSPYLSVQLMQGSIVSTNIGTSAKSQPCKVFTREGMFMLVGVRTRILSRNLLPFPLA